MGGNFATLRWVALAGPKGNLTPDSNAYAQIAPATETADCLS